VRELLRRGLAAEGYKLAEAGKLSSAYGVTDQSESARLAGDGHTKRR
jgi:hypothetical protein